MYAVTQDFLDQMKANKRKVDAKVTIDYTDPELDQSITVTTTENANVSYPQQTADGVTTILHKWASLDGSWILDGSYYLAPTQEEYIQFGWWGKQLSGSDCSFANPYPTLTVTHFARPIYSLKVVGDSARNEYPTDFTIDLYAADGTKLYTKSVTGNTQVNWSYALPSPVLDVVKQVLTITKWNMANRQVKITEFFTSIQETYMNDDIVKIDLLEEREASQGSLPVGNITSNEVTLTLVNKDKKFNIDNTQSPLNNLLKPNRKIKLWLGVNNEWVLLGTFWSLDWDSPDDVLEATVTARDRLELLRKGTYQSSQVQTNVSLYTLAQQVLQDAGLDSTKYSIDTALQSIIVPYAWFNSTTHREALRTIAEAALAVVYADRDGILQIQSFNNISNDILEITEDDYFLPLRNPSQQSQVSNKIIVNTNPLTPQATQEVYRSNSTISVPANGSVTITAFYNQTPVINATASIDGSPSGISIASVTYYGWGATVKIQNTNASSASVTLVINGQPLTVQNKEQYVASDSTSITENGELQYQYPDNPLIQTLSQAQQIATTLLASVKDARRDIQMDWRGNPALLLGDKVTVKGNDYYVIRQEITWQGYLEANLTGRKVE